LIGSEIWSGVPLLFAYTGSNEGGIGGVTVVARYDGEPGSGDDDSAADESIYGWVRVDLGEPAQTAVVTEGEGLEGGEPPCAAWGWR
jgi:hypothetical protein